MGGLSVRDAGGRGFGPDEALGGADSELVEAALGRGTLVLGGCDGAGVSFPAVAWLPIGGDWDARGCPEFCLPCVGDADAWPEPGAVGDCVVGACGVAAAPVRCWILGFSGEDVEPESAGFFTGSVSGLPLDGTTLGLFMLLLEMSMWWPRSCCPSCRPAKFAPV